VLADFQRPTPVTVALGYSQAPGMPGFGALWVISGDDRSGRFAVTVETGARGEELLFQIADGLSQDFAESLAWGEARPECPGHPHPLELQMIDHQAWWVCPRDQRQVKRVGSADDSSPA
jgi:hypothetical protein